MASLHGTLEEMKELEENTLRRLLTQFREDSPEEFVALVVSTLLMKVPDDTVVSLEQFDDDNIRTSAILVVKGVKKAGAVIEALMEMEAEGDAEDADPDPSDPSAEDGD